MTPPASRSGTSNIPQTTQEYIKKCSTNDPLVLIFRNSLFTAFAIAVILTWADAILEVVTDALDTWKLGTAKIIGSCAVTAFCLFGVMFLSFLFDCCGHKITPSN